tara:strand:- start:532 stop:804 length:273 start_codon:yes stop_codon:yes gene_type:complete
MATYKIMVPKVGSMDETGNTVGLYTAGQIVHVEHKWQQTVMDAFSSHGWAIEVKTVEPDVTVTTEAVITVSSEDKPKPKRGRPRKIAIDI